MHQTLLNDKNPEYVRKQVQALDLPGFKGLTTLNRLIDETGNCVLENGKPINVPSYIIVKCNELSSEQEQAINDVVNAAPLAADADVVSKRDRGFHILRRERDSLLVDSDHNVAPDRWRSMDAATQDKWAAYRQELRDLPETYTTDPDSVVWPDAPE